MKISERGTGWIGWAAMAAAIAVALWTAQPASAGSLTLWAGPAGETGLQMDVAELSPRLDPHRPGVNGTRPYIVQPGETLSQIAEQFGVSMAALAALNGLADLDQVQAGQTLLVNASVAAPPGLPVNAPLSRLQFWPWPPVQGQTLAIWLSVREPVPCSVSVGGNSYPVQMHAHRGWALAPIPALIEPGDAKLTLQIGESALEISLPIQGGDFGFYDVPADVSAPILSQADAVQAEAERLWMLFTRVSDLGWTARSRFEYPLEGDYPRTSPFGTRRTYGGGPAISAHSGEDFSAPAGTIVRAPAAGVVVLAEQLFVRGNAVILDHGHGVFTGYWHLQTLNVAAGDVIAPGDVAGEVGSTGLSTGPHLHWELRVAGIPVDPLQWLAP